MFTGLVETTGIIREYSPGSRSVRIGVAPSAEGYAVAAGDSVSVSGVCLTLEDREGGVLRFRAVEETLRRTTLTHARPGTAVNLERAVRPGDRMGGHFVLGHVDAVGRIRSDQQRGDSLERTIEVPGDLVPFLAEKGSVAVDGVSLTIAAVTSDAISVSLIPYSLRHTTMSALKPGDTVNVECDVLSRYVVHFLRAAAGSDPAGATTRPCTRNCRGWDFDRRT